MPHFIVTFQLFTDFKIPLWPVSGTAASSGGPGHRSRPKVSRSTTSFSCGFLKGIKESSRAYRESPFAPAKVRILDKVSVSPVYFPVRTFNCLAQRGHFLKGVKESSRAHRQPPSLKVLKVRNNFDPRGLPAQASGLKSQACAAKAPKMAGPSTAGSHRTRHGNARHARQAFAPSFRVSQPGLCGLTGSPAAGRRPA